MWCWPVRQHAGSGHHQLLYLLLVQGVTHTYMPCAQNRLSHPVVFRTTQELLHSIKPTGKLAQICLMQAWCHTMLLPHVVCTGSYLPFGLLLLQPAHE